jgi:hypothetical protein
MSWPKPASRWIAQGLDYHKKSASLQWLRYRVGEFDSVAEFLHAMKTMESQQLETPRGVNLNTIHGVKGLEYATVFLIGMEEGKLPHRQSLKLHSDPEEERRLCYVGMTRAKECLYLFGSRTERVNGHIERVSPSRYLADIPPPATRAERERVDVNEVKAHHPVVDVVARYVPLRRTGRTFVGPCPFHHDTGRPNLVIFPATDTWFCFRCGAGGDAVTFVEKRERVGFLDAVARLTGNVLPAPKSPLPSNWRSLIAPLPQLSADTLRMVQGAAMAYYATLLGDPEAKRCQAIERISRSTERLCSA